MPEEKSEYPEEFYDSGRFGEDFASFEEAQQAFKRVPAQEQEPTFDEFLAQVRANRDRITDPALKAMVDADDVEGLRKFYERKGKGSG